MSEQRNPLIESLTDELLPALMARKSIIKSKTFWLQMLALVCTLSPAVRHFITTNPVEFVAVLGALNVLMRFATRGEVGLTSSSGEENRGGGSWWNPLLMAMGGMGAIFAAHPSLMAL